MARIAPFQPFRYSASAGNLDDLVTQPYDKITPAMQTRYLHLSPKNLVRVILGERSDKDTDRDNVYTRAAGFFEEWIRSGVLQKEAEPSLYAYFQEFTMPDTGERLTRKGFIGLGAVEDYSAGVVHRHEQTLSGPKKDRREVLEHTKAHFGQIFMLYPDPELRIDALLNASASGGPIACVHDEYGTVHTVYKLSDPGKISRIQQLMSDKKLLIADGHHRYETALAYRQDHPEIEDAAWVMMTFVNMHSPGLRILPTHRVVNGLDQFNPEDLLSKVRQNFTLSRVDTPASLTQLFEQPCCDRVRIGMSFECGGSIYLLERPRRPEDLDVRVLHDEILEPALGIDAAAVRDEKHLRYVRGLENATDMICEGAGQIAFLLEATTIEQVAGTSFAGGVMPQKSTDFYPKLLTGLTIYKLEK